MAKRSLEQAIGITTEIDETRSSIPQVLRYALINKDLYPNKGKDLPDDFVKYFIPESEWFEKKKRGKKNDWMQCQKESGQTFIQWQRSGSSLPFGRRITIYLIPLTFNEDPIPKEIIDPIRAFAAVFFQIPVKVMGTKKLNKEVPNRINSNSNTYQVDAGKVLEIMKPLVPSDAFCVAGITMCDLYPRESWNFVFGLANLAGNCGIYSLARYLSNFGKTQTTVYEPASEEGGISTIIKRACKTMCHEIGHMFGLKHCVFYECLMNGSNHLEESDGRPLFLCPVCLRKLQFSCKFDIEERYRQMIPILEEFGFRDDANWLRTRLARLETLKKD
ncbi:archaemetzincin-2-like [Mytilus edulis]|uniref:archaemetzincin-2-like n=1 Tax=Mytilus edulis TaxID=6550 RepID=UPI0039EE6EFA